MSFPQPLLSTVNNQLHGRIFTLLDPVRDANFLNRPTTDALGNTIPDMGLGVVDNGMFFYTSKFQPSDPSQPRPYPVKFFWLGSPAGTNDATDNFSIFMADVDINAFYAGAPASVYLRNPRLVLSVLQAGKDIINWFDANYPYTTTPASGGVGQETPNGQSNTTYGILSSGGNPGNVSRMASLSAGASIDGQFWPIYDYVDNSIILYFSIKTPNCNTLSIYTYKTLDSEITSPLTSSQFVGGVYWRIGNVARVASSHRFSILSPDPLVSKARVPGQQQAVIAYSFGVLDTVTPDHGLVMQGQWVPDIHTSPSNWNAATGGPALLGLGLDVLGLSNIDKIGNIIPIGTEFTSGSYGILFDATSDRDVRSGSDNVVIDATQVRIAYLHLLYDVTVGTAVYGDPLIELQGPEAIGHCRPFYTTLPDGLPKIIFNQWNFDQSLKTVYQYIDPAKLRPENNKRLVFGMDNTPDPFLLATYQKKKAIVILGQNPEGTTNDPIYQPTCVEVQEIYGSVDLSTGIYKNSAVMYNNGTVIPVSYMPLYSISGRSNSGIAYPVMAFFELEDLPPYLLIQMYGNNGSVIAVVILEDE